VGAGLGGRDADGPPEAHGQTFLDEPGEGEALSSGQGLGLRQQVGVEIQRGAHRAWLCRFLHFRKKTGILRALALSCGVLLSR
jgi:hypothetical protein